LRDVASDQQNQGRQVRIAIDRDTASRLGITAQNIDDALYDAFGQRQISTIYTQLNQYHVVIEAKPEFQKSPQDLSKIFLQAQSANQGGQSSTPGAPSGAPSAPSGTSGNSGAPAGASGAPS